MGLSTRALSWWKCHIPNLKSAGLFRRNHFLNTLKTQRSIPCWISVQWEPSACRSYQCCQKKGSSNVSGWICSVWPSWVWDSYHASTGNSVSWSLGHSSRTSFIAGHQSIKTCRIWIDQLDHLPAVMTTFTFWSSLSTLGTNLAQLFRIFSSARIIACTVPTLTSNCLYRHTMVLIHEILYLANQLGCSDFLTPPTPLIIPHRLPAFL